MNRKKEIIKAIFSLVILAIILILIIAVTLLITEGLRSIGIDIYYYSSLVSYTVMGVSIGLGAGFGFIVAKRLFEVTIEK